MPNFVDQLAIHNAFAQASGTRTYDWDLSAYRQATFYFWATAQSGDASAMTMDAFFSRADPTKLSDSLGTARWITIANSSITQITTDSAGATLLTSSAMRQVTLSDSMLIGQLQLSVTVAASSGTAPTLTNYITAVLKG